VVNATPARDWTSPVIIVGAGRSGTTRLAATLGAHRDLYMIGETSFLLPRLWATFFERPAYVRMWRLSKLAHQSRPGWRQMPWFEFDSAIVVGALESLGTALTEIEAAETIRLQRAFGGSLRKRRSRRRFGSLAGGSRKSGPGEGRIPMSGTSTLRRFRQPATFKQFATRSIICDRRWPP
jgi:Sulfotransferase family